MSGTAFGLLSPFIDLGLGKGSRIAADRLNSTAWAKQVFQRISKLLGRAEAQRIFLALATPPSKAEAEELRNCELLQMYIVRGWPIQKLAKHVAKINKTLPANERFGTRGGSDDEKIMQDRIDKQLRRLLKNGPPKDARSALRIFIDQARALPTSRAGRPRKQNRPK